MVMARTHSRQLDLASRQVRQTAERDFSYYNVKRFVLHPGQWGGYPARLSLNWTRVQFRPDNRDQVPDDQTGVYSFAVQPSIAQHPGVSYLLYVGMTDKQSFRARYDQYAREPSNPKRREHIAQMLEKWPQHLWFYFAAVSQSEDVAALEDELLSSYLPPHNRTFPADIRATIRRIFQ